jgi:glutathione synthase
MRLLFILDPLEQLKTYKDTSVALMREADKRGHEIYTAMQSDWLLRHAQVMVKASTFSFTDGANWYVSGTAIETPPAAFDAILMRKDPPFDNEYLYSTYLLELAVKQGAKVYNDPVAIRGWNEKLSIARFAEFAPSFIVTPNITLIRDFLKTHGDIIVKPLDGMGGSGVFRLRTDDANIGVILETITHFGERTVMAQRYVPEITSGDKRIIMIDGKPLPYALARIPQGGETRGNLAAGGKGVAQPLSDRDLEIASHVGPALQEHGLFLVGLDVIGDYLTEVNVTSPTGMVEIAAQTDCDPASLFMDALEDSCASS